MSEEDELMIAVLNVMADKGNVTFGKHMVDFADLRISALDASIQLLEGMKVKTYETFRFQNHLMFTSSAIDLILTIMKAIRRDEEEERRKWPAFRHFLYSMMMSTQEGYEETKADLKAGKVLLCDINDGEWRDWFRSYYSGFGIEVEFERLFEDEEFPDERIDASKLFMKSLEQYGCKA